MRYKTPTMLILGDLGDPGKHLMTCQWSRLCNQYPENPLIPRKVLESWGTTLN